MAKARTQPKAQSPASREAHWRAVYADWEKSGLSQKDFCRQKGHSIWTFRNWRTKLKKADRSQRRHPAPKIPNRSSSFPASEFISISITALCALGLGLGLWYVFPSLYFFWIWIFYLAIGSAFWAVWYLIGWLFRAGEGHASIIIKLLRGLARTSPASGQRQKDDVTRS